MFELTKDSIDFLVNGAHVLVHNHKMKTLVPCKVEVIYSGLTESEPQWVFTTLGSRVDAWNDNNVCTVEYDTLQYRNFIKHLRLSHKNNYSGDAILTRTQLVNALDTWQYVIA